ncbi:MAG: cobalamin biosynthesis protein CobD [Helicobacteraceae bacterium]|nr:cobalamin biosynthesis protein CobD [Candidatus Sulfurimonas ponti]
MSNILIAIFAYLIDKVFGEFTFIKHPVIIIGELISYFEKCYYKDNIAQGFYLVLFVLSIVSFVSVVISLFLAELPLFIEIIVSSLIASIFVAHRMLYDSVKNILTAENKKESISMLVSRDTKDMSDSDVYKAAIETYAENLSDGVVAPLFYLLLFGLPGIVMYKAVNTMDSMVGYRNETYENYGKVAAILDDILNYVPSRLTAVFIMILAKQKNIFAFYEDGKKHDSPNAGHPITAMALALDVKLGGDTSYFGKIKKKAYFGKGTKEIRAQDVQDAINLGKISLWK